MDTNLNLNKKQIEELRKIISKYQIVNKKLADIEKIISDTKAQSEICYNELDKIREEERVWVNNTSEELGINNNELFHLCMNVLQNPENE